MSLGEIVTLLYAVLALLGQPGMAQNPAVQGLAAQAIGMATQALQQSQSPSTQAPVPISPAPQPFVETIKEEFCTVEVVWVRDLTQQEKDLHVSMGITVPNGLTHVKWFYSGPAIRGRLLYEGTEVGGALRSGSGYYPGKDETDLAGKFPQLTADFNGTVCASPTVEPKPFTFRAQVHHMQGTIAYDIEAENHAIYFYRDDNPPDTLRIYVKGDCQWIGELSGPAKQGWTEGIPTRAGTMYGVDCQGRKDWVNLFKL